MPNTENRKNSNKKPTLQEHSQTVIIPQLTPEMLEQARRAAEQGKTAEEVAALGFDLEQVQSIIVRADSYAYKRAMEPPFPQNPFYV